MMINAKIPMMQVPLETIRCAERIRIEPGDIRGMADSLEANGQFHPIVLNGNELVAGARRFFGACALASEGRTIGGKLPENDPRRLEPHHILATQLHDLSPLEQIQIEIEENRQRKDFTSAEDAVAMKKLQKNMEKAYGRKVSKKELAKTLKISPALTTMALTVADGVEAGDKSLLKRTVRGAYDKIKTAEKVAEITARLRKQSENIIPDIEQRLVCDDARDWIQTIPDESVDFVNFDPPWGIGIDDYDRRHAYEKFDDDVLTFQQLVTPLIPELYRVLKPDTWMIMWFGIQFYDQCVKLLGGTKKEPMFNVDPVPCVWYKPNKAGATNNPERHLMNVYEPFLVCRKGDPRLFRSPMNNVFPVNMEAQRRHLAQKPRELNGILLSHFTLQNMIVLDPTFGSGSIFESCKVLKRGFLGCDKSVDNVRNAILAVQVAQTT